MIFFFLNDTILFFNFYTLVIIFSKWHICISLHIFSCVNYAWIFRSDKDVLLLEFDNVYIINSDTGFFSAVAYKAGRKMAANTEPTYCILVKAKLSSTKPPSLQLMFVKIYVCIRNTFWLLFLVDHFPIVISQKKSILALNVFISNGVSILIEGLYF